MEPGSDHPFSRARLGGYLARLRGLNRYVGAPRLTPWGAFTGLIALLGLIGTLVGLGQLTGPPPQMTGEFRVAVAAFDVEGNRDSQSAGKDVAGSVYDHLQLEFTALSPDFIIETWGPEEVGTIRGATREARARAAADKAAEIDADIVVYGRIDATKSVWDITPEFYVSDQNLHDAQELTGQHEIGRKFQAIAGSEFGRRLKARDQMVPRSQLLSLVTVGLGYYSAQDYPRAQAIFQQVEREFDWSIIGGGQEVLYVLLGNAAGKADELEQAEAAYRSGLAANPDYARAYVGLGSVLYSRALQSALATDDPTAIDVAMMEQAIAHYERAATAADRPALSDVLTKVQFGLGQAYLALYLQDGRRPIAPAIEAFRAVIADYGDGDNPRVRELAGEAHARLGLIAHVDGRIAEAIAEYELAVPLLDISPTRQSGYQQRLEELRRLP